MEKQIDRSGPTYLRAIVDVAVSRDIENIQERNQRFEKCHPGMAAEEAARRWRRKKRRTRRRRMRRRMKRRRRRSRRSRSRA